MFRFKATQDQAHQAEPESLDDSTIKSDIGAFSFFGFNLFEGDETLQYDDVESFKVREDSPAMDTAPKTETKSKRVFRASQAHSRNMDDDCQVDGGDETKSVGVMTKIKGNLSRTLGSIKNVDLKIAERIRSTSKRTGKIFDRGHSKEAEKYETRDDFEQNHGTSYVDSFELTSRDAYDEVQSSDKKCYPVWPLKKTRATTRCIEPMHTIQELNVEHHTPSNRHQQHQQQQHHQHQHHRRSSSGAVGTTRHSSNKYDDQPQYYVNTTTPSKQLRTNGSTYVKASNYDDNIWDDQSTSSGWFSLESLDAR